MAAPVQLSFNPELWARTDMTPDQKMHTTVVLGLSALVACEEPDAVASEALKEYLNLYASGVDPFEAVESSYIAYETEA